MSFIPYADNWSVTPVNGQVGYFDDMNIWLGESTNVIQTLNDSITAFNMYADSGGVTYSVAEIDALLDEKVGVDSPAFTGTPTAPTPLAGDNSTKISTTAYVVNAILGKAPLLSPAFTGTPTAPTPAAGDDSTKIATTEFVKEAIDNSSIGNDPAKTVISWSFATTTINLEITAHGLVVDDYFIVSGLVSTTNAPNGVYKVSNVVDVNNIEYVVATAPTGTPTVSSAELFKSVELNNIVSKENVKIVDFGTVTSNQRYKIDNPFGNENYQGCSATALVFANSIWSETGYLYTTVGYGTRSFSNIDGITVQTGNTAVAANSSIMGGGHGLTGAGTIASALCVVVVTYNGKESNA